MVDKIKMGDLTEINKLILCQLVAGHHRVILTYSSPASEKERCWNKIVEDFRNQTGIIQYSLTSLQAVWEQLRDQTSMTELHLQKFYHDGNIDSLVI